MAFPFSPESRSGRRQYDRLAEEPSAAEEENQLKPLKDVVAPVEFLRAQDGESLKGSSVAASEDLPDLLPVHNRDHTNVSVTSTVSDLRSTFGSAGSGSSLWSSGSLTKDVAAAVASAAGDEAGGSTVADAADFETKMQKYQQRRNDRLMKKKSRQTATYGDFLGKCANSKHSEDALSISLAVRGMKIDELEPLSQGTFARVYKGVWDGKDFGHGSEMPVAVKCMRTRWSTKWMSSGGTEHIPVWLDREVKVCKTLKHPNLIECYHVAVDVAPYVLVLEYCAGGSVSALMDSLRASGLPPPFLERFSWRQRVKVASDIADGMLYLHNQKVVHRDLKPQNILLRDPITSAQDECFAKVGDFGLARSLSQELDSKFLSHQVGSWEHMAPEVVDVEANADYDEKVDVYSFALIMYELASGRWPFSGMDKLGGDSKKISQFVLRGGRPTWTLVPNSAPKVFQSLVPLGWSQTPGERPSFETVISELRTASFELLEAETVSEPTPAAPLERPDLITPGDATREADLTDLRDGIKDVLDRKSVV